MIDATDFVLPAETASAVIVDIDGHTLVTGVAGVITSLDQLPREMAAEYAKVPGNDKLMWLSGHFVEAEKANVNGAYWSSQDLEFGEMTVTHAPVNFLHRTRHIIGTVTESRLLRPSLTAVRTGETAADRRAFIDVNAALWKEFFPYETRMVEMASDRKQLFWSMECQSKTIRCETAADGSRAGCGREYPFSQVWDQPHTVCDHIRNKTSQRHFVEPRFNAAGIIVPPVRPGWGGATAQVKAQVEKLTEHVWSEAASMREYDDSTLIELMSKIVEFGKSLPPVAAA